MEIISTNALISINATFFAQLVSFLIFIFVLNRVMIRPLRNTAAKRLDYLSEIQDKIDNSKEELKIILSEFKKKKSQTINDSVLITSQLEDDAYITAMDIYNKTKIDISVLQKKSDAKIRDQISDLRTIMHRDIDNISVLVMEKLLGRRLKK